MNLDDLLREIGEWGPYQKWVYALAVIPSALVGAEALSVIFIFFIPPHRCALPRVDNDTYASQLHNDKQLHLLNLTLPQTKNGWDSCYIYDDVTLHDDVNGTFDVMGTANASKSPCNRWVYDQSIFQSTIATDFDVVCDRTRYRADSNVMSELGTLFGMLVCGILADRFGRKLTFIVSSILLFAAGIGIAFVTSLTSLNVCRFIMGSARMSAHINGLVMGVEMVGPSKRALAGLCINFLWILGEFYLVACAYFVRNWRYLEIAVSVPGVFFLSYWWLMPESPRWLISHGRDAEAMTLFKKIADSNNRPMPDVTDTKLLLEKKQRLSLSHVFLSRELLKRLVIVAINMFVNCMVYYGTALNITNLSGDLFVNSSLTFALEILSDLVGIWLLYRMGRKPVYIGTLLAGSVCCVLCIIPVLMNASELIVTGVSMVGRFFITISYAVSYVYCAELFPTVVRASAFGACVAFSRVANLVSPYLADLALLVDSELRSALPLLVMGSPAILAALLALTLPETRGVTLPETLADLDKGSCEIIRTNPSVKAHHIESDTEMNCLKVEENQDTSDNNTNNSNM